MKKSIRPVIIMMITFLITMLFFSFLQSYDNKYTIKQPIGQDGIISLTQEDLSRQTGLSDLPTGEAVYSLTLNYSGNEMIVAVTFPELISESELYINGQKTVSGKGNTSDVFILTQGKTILQLKVKNTTGYYSGMYFSGAIGTVETVGRILLLKNICYLAAFTIALTLAVYSFAIWKDKKTAIYRLFGMFCLSFCLYICYHIVHLLHLPFENNWYFVEDIAFYLMSFYILRLSMACAKIDDRNYLRIIRTTGIIFPVISAILYLLIPLFPAALNIHGVLQDTYRVLLFIWLTGIALYAAFAEVNEYWYLLLGNMIFGTGLLVNFLFSNRFEPIYTFWQLEWCGIYLIIIFAAMMVKRNQRIIAENIQLTETLEDQITLRTQKLNSLLEERREFFFQLAHNLKAPITATNHYIQLIKNHHIDIDEELSQYIELINEKQGEIINRIDTINTLSQLDKITDAPERIGINSFMNEIYHSFKPEADVLTIYLKLNLASSEMFISAQKEKLVILMENLICNAFSFTQTEGSVTLSTSFTDNQAVISVEDTGCGIPESKISHIFDRFYVGRNNKKDGSGLGLYIVKLIAEEFDGTVQVSSTVGKGSRFSVYFPTI